MIKSQQDEQYYILELTLIFVKDKYYINFILKGNILKSETQNISNTCQYKLKCRNQLNFNFFEHIFFL